MGVSKNNGTPKWMVKIMENPIRIDDLGGNTPIFGGPPIYVSKLGVYSLDVAPLTRCNRSSYEGLGFRLESSTISKWKMSSWWSLASWPHPRCTSQFYFFTILFPLFKGGTPPKTNMTMENQPFEDVSPIRNGDFPLSC